MSQPHDQAAATALQRVLLPPGLPEIQDWAVCTLYEPGDESALIGGDFYDWFTLPNQNVVLVVGDVSGSGPHAGALGMSIRKALKGICWTVSAVADAFPVLERALRDELHGASATLCAVEIEPSAGRVVVVLAGHPAPWLRRVGSVERVEAPGNAALGSQLQGGWESLELHLEAGDSLVVHSDGLSDAELGDGRRMGDGPFQEFLASLPAHLSSYETVIQIDQHVRRATPRLQDDVVIGVLTRLPRTPDVHAPTGGGEMVALRLTPDSSSAAMARRFVVDACDRWQVPTDDVQVVRLVASELVTNAVLHARTEMELRVAAVDDTVRVEVMDRLPADLHPGGADGEGLTTHGRGLKLVQELSRDFGVENRDGSKIVWATVGVAAG